MMQRPVKKNIHPKYHTITVVMTDGEEFTTRSTWGKEGSVMRLDTDPKTHVAWTKTQTFVKRGRVAKFNNRFDLGKFSVPTL